MHLIKLYETIHISYRSWLSSVQTVWPYKFKAVRFFWFSTVLMLCQMLRRTFLQRRITSTLQKPTKWTEVETEIAIEGRRRYTAESDGENNYGPGSPYLYETAGPPIGICLSNITKM